MAKYADNANFTQVSVDISPYSYIQQYFLEPSVDHQEKFPTVIFDRLDFMGSLSAIEFWMWLFEQPKLGEHRCMKGQRLVWGYVDRLANCAAIFVNLSKESQDYILRARRQEQPIYWRGEDMSMFKRIAKESYKYNQLTEEERLNYRKTALRQAMELSRATA